MEAVVAIPICASTSAVAHLCQPMRLQVKELDHSVHSLNQAEISAGAKVAQSAMIVTGSPVLHNAIVCVRLSFLRSIVPEQPKEAVLDSRRPSALDSTLHAQIVLPI
eukprot:TRINITY_DN9351_c0_g1_i1.p2 TRINITY_DN9351_c0_g1~~TRINITY_DN9351_c0_g1_i1.p2  ORF type:complete len:121 (-),score=10.18 TRINITY_DN9351_c0_g1_i1:16-336(-)